MARYDKYDGKAGGFRAVLEVGLSGGDVAVPLGVGVNASGRVVKGAGTSGIAGVLLIDTPKSAGDVVDVMTSGEIVDVAALTGGTEYFATAAGALDTVATGTKVGFTAEASRLIVRCTGQVGA